MYIPLAVHKNELVVIDNMDTFSHYFCLAKKQKMTPLLGNDKVVRPEDLDEDMKPRFFEDGGEDTSPDDDDL